MGNVHYKVCLTFSSTRNVLEPLLCNGSPLPHSNGKMTSALVTWSINDINQSDTGCNYIICLYTYVHIRVNSVKAWLCLILKIKGSQWERASCAFFLFWYSTMPFIYEHHSNFMYPLTTIAYLQLNICTFKRGNCGDETKSISLRHLWSRCSRWPIHSEDDRNYYYCLILNPLLSLSRLQLAARQK